MGSRSTVKDAVVSEFSRWMPSVCEVQTYY